MARAAGQRLHLEGSRKAAGGGGGGQTIGPGNCFLSNFGKRYAGEADADLEPGARTTERGRSREIH